MLHRFIKYIIPLSLLAMVSACANVISPSGGPKDLDPPVILRSEPQNQSTGFSQHEIIFQFDEYVELKDFNTQFIASPPLQMPNTKIKGKSLTVSIKDTLKPNTTYVLSFGNSLVDFHENTPLAGMQYIFSTGKHIDTLNIYGEIKKAFTLEPEKEMMVMLYDAHAEDSVIYKEKPLFVARSKEDGRFRLQNLPDGCYKMVAIRDANKNLLFDAANEEIAFISSCIRPQTTIKPDTVKKADSIAAMDSLSGNKPEFSGEILYAYKEILKQNIESEKFVEPGHIQLTFRNSVEKYAWQFIEPAINPQDLQFKWDKSKKIVDIWFKDRKEKKLTLTVEDHHFRDTVKLLYDKTINEPAKSFAVKRSGGEKQHFYELVKLSWDVPLARFNPKGILLTEDSTQISVNYKFTDESKTEIVIDAELQPATTYQIFIRDSFFVNMFDQTNDTVKLKFSTNHPDEMGSLEVTMQHVQGNMILQLLNESQAVLEEHYIHSGGKETFKYMQPGIYMLKVIFDENNNKQWDAGNYMQKRLPEKVLYYPKKITVEAGWDYQETWNIEKP